MTPRSCAGSCSSFNEKVDMTLGPPDVRQLPLDQHVGPVVLERETDRAVDFRHAEYTFLAIMVLDPEGARRAASPTCADRSRNPPAEKGVRPLFVGVACEGVVVGVGANLGAREGAVRGARVLLDARTGIEVERVSSIYETEPLGPPQPRYLNAAFRLRHGAFAAGAVARVVAHRAAARTTSRAG